MSLAQLQQAFDNHKDRSRKKFDIVETMEELSRRDPVEFLESRYGWYTPDTGMPHVWQNWERLLFRKIFDSNKKIRGIFDIKKNLKTTKSAAIMYINAWRKPCEQFVIANKKKQSEGRAFQFVVNVINMNPAVGKYCKVVGSKIKFPNGSTIEALPQDASGEAGTNHFCVVFDEVWGMTSARNFDMAEEFTIPPTQPDGFQLFTSYAGYEKESRILESLYEKVFDEDLKPLPGTKKVDVGEFYWENEDYDSREFPLFETESMLIYWSNGPLNGHPGQEHHTEEYFIDQRINLRKKKFMQLHENKWTSGSDDGIFEDVWRNCKRASLNVILNDKGDQGVYDIPSKIRENVPLFVGVDGSIINDHTFVTSVYPYPYYEKKLALGPTKGWKPEKGKKINLQEVEDYIYELTRHYWVKMISYDPTELHKVMTDVSIQVGDYRVDQFNQTTNNLMKAADNLYVFLNYNMLVIPQDKDLQWYAENAIKKENKEGGWKISKEVARKKIDFIAALSFCCLRANEELKFYTGKVHQKSHIDRARQELIKERERKFADSQDYGGSGFDTQYARDLQDSLNGLSGF